MTKIYIYGQQIMQKLKLSSGQVVCAFTYLYSYVVDDIYGDLAKEEDNSLLSEGSQVYSNYTAIELTITLGPNVTILQVKGN